MALSTSEKPMHVEVENESNDSTNGYTKSTPNNMLRYDRHGLPLMPQPSADPMDPLNWKPWLKILVLAQVSVLSFVALLSASLITPAFVPLSKFLHRSLVQTAYVTSTFIACVGVSSLFWNPISNIYGRRPIYILSIAVSIATGVGSGVSKSYGELLTFRALNGFFGGVPLGLGSATVCDLFFTHERGFYMGIYTVSLISGGHVAPIIGGYIEENLTWHWCFYIPAIISSFLLVLFILTVPETLFSRSSEALSRPSRSWAQNMTLRGGRAHPTRNLHLIDFLRPLQLLVYPDVLFPAAYYAVSFAYGSILFIISSAALFKETYHFQPQQTGLLLGTPLTVGSLLGECVSGGFSDWISNRRAMRRDGQRIPEDRLLAIWPASVFTPLGIIIEGICIQHKTHWIGVAMGIAIASFGLQIATTVIYTYTAECHKPQSPELGSLLNFARQLYSFSIGFYAVPFGEKIGIQDAWVVLAMITVALFFPIVGLMIWGREWRGKFKEVSWHGDL